MSDSARYSGEFSLVAAGDSMVFERLSVFKEQEFLRVREILKKADAAFTNFETIMRNGKGFPRHKADPTVWLSSAPFALDELKWMGFSLFSVANNHSMDYSEAGLMENLKIFEKSGVTFAGVGRNLSEARAAAYLNTPNARVGLVAMNTRGEDGPAGESWGRVQGRPGLNPMRFTTMKYLKKEDFDKLAEISRKLGLPEVREGKLDFLGLRELRSIDRFEIGEEATIRTHPYPPDMRGNLRSISRARRNSDFVFVSIHNHEKLRPGEDYFDDTIEYVAEFVEGFSRAAIDAGADAVLGHGTHVLNGIEIYKGSPIFHGLGNFISQSYQAVPQPYDYYEARDLHEKCQTEDIVDVRPVFDRSPVLTKDAEKRRTRRLTTSVIAQIDFCSRKATGIKLYPIELSTDRMQKGRPVLASGESANEILTRLSRLSAKYRTKIEVDHAVGKITL
jgi:poly-gamma-glutamate synthesis protein (capsule biosynthesis protein)